MLDQKTQFCFEPEENPSVNLHRENGERFTFFLKVICVGVLCLGTGVWFVSYRSNRMLASDRTIQSLSASFETMPEAVDLKAFFVLLKSGSGVQLTKVEVGLQVDHPLVLNEIQESTKKIQDHLVFILSNKDISVFSDLEKRQLLKKEIIDQLNLFLVSGKIQNVQLKETF